MECIKKHTDPGETILIFSGLLNFMVRKAFLRALKDAQSERTQHVILDLTQVSFIDCSVLGILVQAIHDLTQTQTTLSLIIAKKLSLGGRLGGVALLPLLRIEKSIHFSVAIDDTIDASSWAFGLELYAQWNIWEF